MKGKNYFFTAVIVTFLFSNIYSLSSESLQKKKDQKSEEHEVTVTLKLIQVYVTDKEGNPIMDLGKNDFNLYDNRRKQKITDFERHILFGPSGQPDSREAKSVAPHPDEEIKRRFLLFFDFAYNDGFGIRKSKEAALYFINNYLQPDDEVGVVFYSAYKNLTVPLDLTTDRQKARDVIEGFGIEKIFENTDPDIPDVLQYFTFAKIIKDLAKGLFYVPGHKHIILFSSRPYPLDLISKTEYEELIKELASANCFVHSMETSTPTSLGSHALKRVSYLTGGKYFGNIHYYEKSLEQIHKASNSYYVLGYYIGEKWDGKYHKITVEVNKEGCEVHTQRGYFNPKPFTKLSKLEKRLHLENLASNGKSHHQIPLHFPLNVLSCAVNRDSSVFMISKIPYQIIQEISGKKVDVVNIIFDEKEKIVDFKRWEKDFSELPTQDIYYYSLSSLKPGEYKYRVVIRNLDTGRAAVGSSQVSVAEIPDSGISLNPPLLLVSSRNNFYLEGETIQEKNTKDKAIGLLGIYPYDLNLFTPVIMEIEQSTSWVLAILNCSILNIQQPDIKLFLRLNHKFTGEKIPLRFSILDRRERKETQIFYLGLQLDGLKSGEYQLDFLARETESQSESQTTTTFMVK